MRDPSDVASDEAGGGRSSPPAPDDFGAGLLGEVGAAPVKEALAAPASGRGGRPKGRPRSEKPRREKTPRADKAAGTDKAAGSEESSPSEKPSRRICVG